MKALTAIVCLLLAGCTAPTQSQKALLDTSSPITTARADQYTCRDHESLVCREVLGSRVSRREQDCVCQP